jgi:hypothetical protein
VADKRKKGKWKTGVSPYKKTKAHKVIWNKKKVYMKNVIESIEEYQKHNNTRKMY